MFEKMAGGESGSSTMDHPGGGMGHPWTPSAPSSSGMNPLLESVCRLRSAEQKSQCGPALSHTLNRSMRAPLEAIFGNDITLPPLPKKIRMSDAAAVTAAASSSTVVQASLDDSSPDIPDVLQGMKGKRRVFLEKLFGYRRNC